MNLCFLIFFPSWFSFQQSCIKINCAEKFTLQVPWFYLQVCFMPTTIQTGTHMLMYGCGLLFQEVNQQSMFETNQQKMARFLFQLSYLISHCLINVNYFSEMHPSIVCVFHLVFISIRIVSVVNKICLFLTIVNGVDIQILYYSNYKLIFKSRLCFDN